MCVLLSLAMLLTDAGCSGAREARPLPAAALLPVAAATTSDERAAFARTFCATLAQPEHAGRWDACSDYIEGAGDPGPLPDIDPSLHVVMIPGILGRCVRDEVRLFSEARLRLEELGVETGEVDVSGLGSTTHNAGEIIEALGRRMDADPGIRFLLVGYSKGASDALEALTLDPRLRARTVALITVAGTLAGSRLPDLVPRPFLKLGVRLAPERCGKGDGGGFESLRRRERLAFLARHPQPPVPIYALAAVSSRERTSRVLRTTWKMLDDFGADQDGQMLAHETIAPGARFLGLARGDHWAVALPFEHTASPRLRRLADRNHFPREALLEALVRHVGAALKKGDS